MSPVARRKRGPFLFGIEEECLTTVVGDADGRRVPLAVARFLSRMSELAPTLPGPSGIMNPYGRVYEDCGSHVEMASAECDSPYELALLVERQHELVGRALARLEEEGLPLRLAANNHSGLLTPKSTCWGSHDNYLCHLHPRNMTRLVLPFLVTRVYAGAGGVRFDSGEFVCGVRPLFMRRVSDGGTTGGSRAIHSVGREEHHAGRQRRLYRYHGLLADGHRSQFNLALLVGATALTLRTIETDGARLGARLDELDAIRPEPDWMERLHAYNRLAARGGPPAVHPDVLAIQRVYLEAAQRTAGRLDGPPAWVPRLLEDWAATLDAYEEDDRDWLAARLDAYIKYELYGAVLAAGGHGWEDMRRTNRGLFRRLALLDQDYHSIAFEGSPFDQLERRGALRHRVGERVSPGGERDPWIPDTLTRAAARARFLRDHSDGWRADDGHATAFCVDWASIRDRAGSRMASLDDPFATDVGPWKSFEEAIDLERALHRRARRAAMERFSDRARELAERARAREDTEDRAESQRTLPF